MLAELVDHHVVLAGLLVGPLVVLAGVPVGPVVLVVVLAGPGAVLAGGLVEPGEVHGLPLLGVGLPPVSLLPDPPFPLAL